jgi:hypothetical protein
MALVNNDVALGRALPRLYGRQGWREGEVVALTPPVAVLRGPQAVAEMRDLLVELCLRTGQAGAMDALEIFLNSPSARPKMPYLLLVGLRRTVHPGMVTVDDLDGAVLIYEYRIAGCGTRVFATDDVVGERTVIAPLSIRMEVAEIAGRTLVESGATVALISLEGNGTAPRKFAFEMGPPCRVATRTRSVPRYLPLAATYESTLATLGDDTRRNFRRYRRRLENDFGAEFVPNVQMTREQFFAMNRASTNPLSEEVAVWRYETMAKNTRPVLCGLRDEDGRWLSLLGGFRRGSALHIDWQLNLSGLPRYSLTTVMRAFLMEYEIAQGSSKLVFEGGTPHPMRHSFACVSAVDVIVQRKSLGAWLLRKLSRWIFPPKNFLGHTLRDEHLRWSEW